MTDPINDGGAGAGSPAAGDTTRQDPEEIETIIEGDDDDGGEGGQGSDAGKGGETLEQRKARLERQLDRVKKKLTGKDGKGGQPSNEPVVSKKGFDYGEKAFLKSSGIATASEMALVEKAVKDSGKSIETVLESKWFQAELTEHREDVAAKAALPGNNGRAGEANSAESVEYWLKKGHELPPKGQTELRRKVIAARMQREATGSVFSTTPVVK
jgi:hypothetical protein